MSNENDYSEIIETLAAAVHNKWAEGRKAQGWTYGPVRNDELKQTPCLVDYADLPESEKQVDRDTAAQTITTLTECGYSIVKNN